MRIILDTSVLVAALRSKTGASAEILRLILVGELQLLLGLPLVLEYRCVLFRGEHARHFRLTNEQIEFLLGQLEAIAIPVEVLDTHRPLSNDPNDDMVLELAINGFASHIITNNLKDLKPAAERFNIAAMQPSEFLLEFKDRGTK